MNVRIKLGVVAASVAALALSACGSSSLSGEPGAEEAPSVAVSENVDRFLKTRPSETESDQFRRWYTRASTSISSMRSPQSSASRQSGNRRSSAASSPV